MAPELATYPGYRFPTEIIGHAPWLYHAFNLSLRDVELILAERGIGVTHESIRRWCLRFGAEFARKLRRRRPKPDDTWYIDEVFLRINGVLTTSGGRWTRMASCSTSSCRAAGMRRPPSGSSSACPPA